MINGIGRSTSASTATLQVDVAGPPPASFRYNNPGAQYPSPAAARFGQTGFGIIGGGHKIARFPSPVNGAAANFDLLYRNYTGMAIGAAGTKWTGAHGFGVPGFNPDSILTAQMLDDPAQAIELLKAIAARESGSGNNLNDEQWRQAYEMFKAGSADAFLDGSPVGAEHAGAGSFPPADIVYEPNAPNMDRDVIVKIQEALKSQGFSPGIIDGDYGSNTQKAVRQFQEAKGLTANGAVGRETAAALGVSLLAEAPECDFENTGIFPPVLRQQATANNPLPLLMLVLMMLSKEKPMANDPAKPGQGIDPVGVLLALLVQSALGGKQIDTGQLLTDVLTGKPPALPAPAPTPNPQRQPEPSPQVPTDAAALLLSLLFERLTGKPWPGPTPAELQKEPDAPNPPAQPATSRPSVQLSTGALAIGSILQALGLVGTPFGLGPTPTLNGTLATLIPILTGVFGATGGFGGLLNAGRMLLGGLGGAAARSR